MLAVGDPDAAARDAEAATADDPFDEAACRWFMSAAAQAGEPARALLAYAALRDRLSEELGADPAPQTQDCTWRSCARSHRPVRRVPVRPAACPVTLLSRGSSRTLCTRIGHAVISRRDKPYRRRLARRPRYAW